MSSCTSLVFYNSNSPTTQADDQLAVWTSNVALEVEDLDKRTTIQVTLKLMPFVPKRDSAPDAKIYACYYMLEQTRTVTLLNGKPLSEEAIVEIARKVIQSGREAVSADPEISFCELEEFSLKFGDTNGNSIENSTQPKTIAFQPQ